MTNLIDLATVIERDTFLLRTKKQPEGKLYELRNMEELGPYEQQLIMAQHEKVSRFAQRTRKLTLQEEREVNKALGNILTVIVIDLEPIVLKETADVQRAKIVTAWAMKNGSDEPGAAEGEPTARTTGDSSRASKPSTAATPKAGSTSRRGR